MKHITRLVPAPSFTEYLPLTGSTCPLFLDIETTGLSAEHNRLYLIGCCCPREGALEFHQWFAETEDDEAEILESFLCYTKEFDVLVHFNGDTFDLPFLIRRAELLHLPCHLSEPRSLDLFREVRKIRTLLSLPNLKQKTLESYLGIERKDRMSGGELIHVYQKYLQSPTQESEHLLLIHNEEDILDMPKLLPLLIYPQLLSDDIHVQSLLSLDMEEGETPALTVDLKTELNLPAPLHSASQKGITFLWSGNRLHLHIPLFCGELRYFFEDYKEYYYLPREDTAIHRSVAEFVDRDYRVRCKKETAYIRKVSVFLPLPANQNRKRKSPVSPFRDIRCFTPEFGGPCYLDLQDSGPVRDPVFWGIYMHELLLNQ